MNKQELAQRIYLDTLEAAMPPKAAEIAIKAADIFFENWNQHIGERGASCETITIGATVFNREKGESDEDFISRAVCAPR